VWSKLCHPSLLCCVISLINGRLPVAYKSAVIRPLVRKEWTQLQPVEELPACSGVDPGEVGGPDTLKICRRGQSMY